MELPSIGKHCSYPGCNQLDFLPLKCRCEKTFCSNHFNNHAKQCATAESWEEKERGTFDDVLTCSHFNCKERGLVLITCERCDKPFCIRHRHLTLCEPISEEMIAQEKERYAAPVEQFKVAKTSVDEELNKKLDKAQKTSKHQDLAIKLQLMKLKNIATGSSVIPQTDRLFFNISYLGKKTPIFVSMNWSLGKGIDAIADLMKIQNNNNKSTEKKLRLFKIYTDAPVSENMSVILKTLMEQKVISNGETLIMKYV